MKVMIIKKEVEKLANRVMILGSINVDFTYRVTRFPHPGETITVKQKSTAPGGKGANQAVAAARSGANVAFIGAVGADNDGQEMIKKLAENDVDTSRIAIDPDNGTGSAVITVNDEGQNDILVYGGANQAMTTSQLEGLTAELANTDFLVAQLETPQEVTLAAFKLAKQQKVITILNPAPARELLPELLEYTDIIIPNETESALLTELPVSNLESLLKNAEFYRNHGVKNTIVTLGNQGVFYDTADEHGLVSAFKVKTVDTTAAGDSFIGALVSQLKPDLSNLDSALTYAQRAASLTVQGMGAMPAIPRLAEVEAALKNS